MLKLDVNCTFVLQAWVWIAMFVTAVRHRILTKIARHLELLLPTLIHNEACYERCFIKTHIRAPNGKKNHIYSHHFL